jgi:phospholipid transport system substrate-binding protein
MRRALAILVLLSACASVRADSGPVDTIQRLCDTLISSMKRGKALGFAARQAFLGPEVSRDLNLGLMTRIVVGPRWKGFTENEREGLTRAFTDYSVATYASEFAEYSGEAFRVDPQTSRLENGDVIVHSVLIPKTGDAVHLDYLMREDSGEWRVIDVYLDGTISQLAARRSEYSATLKASGAQGLIELLRKKVSEMGG